MKDFDEWGLMKAHEVAKVLGVKPRTVLRWMREGALPSIHLGKIVRVKRADLERFLAAHRKEGRL